MIGTPSRPSTRRAVKLAGGTLAAALLLSACGSVHPGSAAVVGSDTISQSQADSTALAVCAADSASQPSGVPARTERRRALSLLVQTTLARQFGAKVGVHANQAAVSAGVAQAAGTIKSMPPDRRAELSNLIRDLYASQSIVTTIGRKSLESQGKFPVSAKQASAQGNLLLNRYAKTVDISVDPRYGTYSKGNLASVSGSLSVAVSPQATDGDSSNPSPNFVNSLPAAQKCS